MPEKDIILTINVVEPALVRAVHLQSEALGRELHGIVLVHTAYAPLERPRDTSGLFQEIICNFNDPDELQTILKPYIDRILAVTCRYEEALQPLSQVIPFLPYSLLPSVESLFWSTEKPLMRDRLSNYDRALTPRYQYVDIEDVPRIDQLVQEFEFPVIIKPSGLAKALLVTRCETVDELKACLHSTFQRVYNVYNRELYPGKPGILVEEMMQGQMYSVDAYTMADGETFCLPVVKVVTADSQNLPGFYTYEVQAPTDLPESESNDAFAVCRAAIRALNLRSTTTHIELFRTDNGWKIVEVAARIGGHRDDLYREVYGIEHFFNDLNVHMGVKPVMPSGPARKQAMAFNMYADTEGKLDRIEGLEEARRLESVVYLDDHAAPGDEILFAPNGGNPIIDGVLSNANGERLAADVAEMRRLIMIHVR